MSYLANTSIRHLKSLSERGENVKKLKQFFKSRFICGEGGGLNAFKWRRHARTDLSGFRIPFQQMGPLQINFQDRCQMEALRNTFFADLK